MTVLLVGDDTATYSATNSFAAAGALDAFRFVAVASGTVTTLEVRTNGLTQAATSLEMGIYADDGSGQPGALRGSGLYSGAISPSSWVGPTGLSIDVVAGHTYWLTMLPLGGRLDYAYADSAGSAINDEAENFAANTSLPGTWPGGSLFMSGPIGFRAMGEIAAGPTSGSMALTFEVTDLWRPDAEAVTVHGLVVDPTAGNAAIPLCDSRTGTVTFSAESDLARVLAGLEQITYNVALRVWLGRDCVLWGVVYNMVLDSDACTVTLTAMDPTLRLTRHYFRDGDHLIDDTLLVESSSDPDGYLPLDGTGLKLVRDAGETVSFPTLGIINGTDTFGSATLDPIGVSRGDQCFDIWQQISENLGPEWDLPPETDTPQAYCRLDTFDRKGQDRTATVQLLLGAHADSFKLTEGRKYTNLVHVLDRNAKYRETRVNGTTTDRTGPYIDWDATDYAASSAGEAATRSVLDAAGDEILDAYSLPLREVDVVLSPDRLRYLTDFTHGDTIGAAPQVGHLKLPLEAHRIIGVTLELDGENTKQTLTLLPDNTVEPAGGDPS